MTFTLPCEAPPTQSLKKRVYQKACNRRWLGELQHPADGKTTIRNVAFIVESASLDGRPTLTASTVDTEMGRLLAGMLQLGYFTSFSIDYRYGLVATIAIMPS